MTAEAETAAGRGVQGAGRGGRGSPARASEGAAVTSIRTSSSGTARHISAAFGHHIHGA